MEASNSVCSDTLFEQRAEVTDSEVRQMVELGRAVLFLPGPTSSPDPERCDAPVEPS